ncbi:FecR family protein [Pannonibacter indicus]|uniref:FecR family protein n=1 Tax=Pannonibacter indicus TaxID=466044 RepID=A0A0K6HTX8_9HYPH|nr:FecR family protein [Pannonibacter indicus]CUA94291.1 FecR family protein [Pannonibacter indicus]
MPVTPAGDIKDPALLEAAADWLVRLREAPEDEVLQQAFEVWLTQTPAHAAAWARMNRTWDLLGHAGAASAEEPLAGSVQPVTREPIIHQSVAPSRRPVSGRHAAGPRRWRRSVLAATAGAMAACLVLLAAPTLLLRLEADHYTAAGEQRAITLEDGTRVTLAAASAIATGFTPQARSVELLSGDAYFDVVKDAARPFTVGTGNVRITVLGTSFDVRATSGMIDISLAEGSVQAEVSAGGKVQLRTLVPGEMLSIDRATGHLVIRQIAPEDIGSWRQGRLYVVDATVSSVLEDIARYHSAWIRLTDESLGRQRVTGVFDLNDPDRALRALVEPFEGEVVAVSPYVRLISGR